MPTSPRGEGGYAKLFNASGARAKIDVVDSGPHMISIPEIRADFPWLLHPESATQGDLSYRAARFVKSLFLVSACPTAAKL